MLTTELIVAVGAAALLAAVTFRYLVDTVVRLNRELQATLQHCQTEREYFLAKLDASESKLEECREKIHTIKIAGPQP